VRTDGGHRGPRPRGIKAAPSRMPRHAEPRPVPHSNPHVRRDAFRPWIDSGRRSSTPWMVPTPTSQLRGEATASPSAGPRTPSHGLDPRLASMSKVGDERLSSRNGPPARVRPRGPASGRPAAVHQPVRGHLGGAAGGGDRGDDDRGSDEAARQGSFPRMGDGSNNESKAGGGERFPPPHGFDVEGVQLPTMEPPPEGSLRGPQAVGAASVGQNPKGTRWRESRTAEVGYGTGTPPLHPPRRGRS